MSGQLNFLRRAATTYYTAVTRDKWASFAASIKKSIRERGITSPINILKADGGTMPLNVSLDCPCETIFSGPAASVIGALALTMDRYTSVVVDIGGTITDLALILEGNRFMLPRGAVVGGRYTHVRLLPCRLPLRRQRCAVGRKQDCYRSDRLGPAACFEWPGATPTDAINILEEGKLGSLSLPGKL